MENLDSMSIEELEKAKSVFGELNIYCEIKIMAMQQRLAGNIQVALKLEAACERIYNELPEWARW